MSPRGAAPHPAREDLARLVGSPAPHAWGGRLARLAEPGLRPVRRSAVLVLVGPLASADAPGRAGADVLLTRRSERLRHHPGQVAFPGGGIDPGESAAQAALREAHEETGVLAHGIEVLGELPALPLPASGNHVTPVVAWWHTRSELTPDGVETVQAFTVALADLIAPENRGTVRGPSWSTPAFTTSAGPVVWGFTAFVLDELLTALGWSVPWDTRRLIDLPGGWPARPPSAEPPAGSAPPPAR